MGQYIADVSQSSPGTSRQRVDEELNHWRKLVIEVLSLTKPRKALSFRGYQRLAKVIPARLPPHINQPGIEETVFMRRVFHLDFPAPQKRWPIDGGINRSRARSEAEAVIALNHLPRSGIHRVPAECPRKCVDWLSGPGTDFGRAVVNLALEFILREADQPFVRARVITNSVPAGGQ